ncbi:SAC3 family protein B isoform X2 [Amaranthus tricolor]|uniref:SAC3 family protein B isoform X2 n=1 Tax=Amaranthus tricolor TaxID=29722 RepID=UPI0025855A87|nr:SAC3 family protein B isoform X2 [Amaranthus tricolor]
MIHQSGMISEIQYLENLLVKIIRDPFRLLYKIVQLTYLLIFRNFKTRKGLDHLLFSTMMIFCWIRLVIQWQDVASNLHGHVATQRRQPTSSAAVNNHFLTNPQPSRSKSQRSSLSPPKMRSGKTGVGMPDSQYSLKVSPSDDQMNGSTYMNRHFSHSVPKRTRSSTFADGQTIQSNSISIEDDSVREQQAKARRLARFKTELVESGPDNSIQYSQNISKGRVSSMKIDGTSMEKTNVSGDFSSGSMEDLDLDNENSQSTSIIVGLCTDMCPESERGERERKGDLDQYERLDGDRNQTSRTLAVKKYNRTAEREAELIRPMPILQKTMDYLLGLLDHPYDDKFLRLYNFLWDRMRAIRMDLRMQHIFNDKAITMLEQMIRLHILAMHELCEFSKGEGFSEGFDAHLNIEQMNKTSVELFQLYDDHRKRGIFIPTEKEFRGYYALLKLDKHPGYKVEPAELSLDLAQMTPEIRQTLEVLFARDVARSCRTVNFIAFFRHARNASYLQACLMHAHFSKLRTQALAALHSGLLYNQGVPVARVSKWLGMEDEDIESLLEYHGFSIKEFEEPYMVKEGPFLNDEKDYPTRCSILVCRKKSDTILKDVLSSHQVIISPPKPSKELSSTENRKIKHTAVQKMSPVSDDGLMDIESESSLKRSMQVPLILERRSTHIPLVLESPKSMQVQVDIGESKFGQPFVDNHHRTSSGSPKDNVKNFASFDNRSMFNQPSPVSPKDSPRNFSVQQFVPAAKSSSFGLARHNSLKGPVASSPDIVAQSELKFLQPVAVSANVGKLSTAFEAEPSVVSLKQDDVSIEELPTEEFSNVQEKVDDVADNHDKEVSEAKLRLLLRLWRRRFLRKKYIREQNRISANAALSSLNLGPPIRQCQEKPTMFPKLNIDQAMNKRYKKRQLSLARWNVSEVVSSNLAKKNENSNCICWKVITFSWLQHGRSDLEARGSASCLSLEEWLHYKLIPVRKEEAEDDLVVSAPGLSVWRKWASDHSGHLRCCFSVIKDLQPGNFEKLDGVDALLFPISETLSWDTQKGQLENLVALLPVDAGIPLLIVSNVEKSSAKFSCSIVDKLGLKDLNKSRISRFIVIYLNEEDNVKFSGYFSDQKLKEGLRWLASESRSQPVPSCLTTRELVSFHLNSCLEALHLMGDKVGPYQCISAFNQALDQSINNIVTAANMNPTGWPCPEVFLLDDSTVEFRVVKQFLPSLGWSSPEVVGPLISSLRDCKLPSFSDDMSWMSRGCCTEKDIEDQKQLLQDCLIKYLTKSSSVLNLMMATNESCLMVQKYTMLELHDTQYKVVPSWVPIFRRVFNWHLNSCSSFSCKAYVLEHTLITRSSPIINKLEFEAPKHHYIAHPSLDELVEVSRSPNSSKRVRSSPKGFQRASAIAFDENTFEITMPNFVSEESNQLPETEVVENCDIQARNNGLLLVPENKKTADRLSQLLDQCSILQDEIEKKLSFYF